MSLERRSKLRLTLDCSASAKPSSFHRGVSRIFCASRNPGTGKIGRWPPPMPLKRTEPMIPWSQRLPRGGTLAVWKSLLAIRTCMRASVAKVIAYTAGKLQRLGISHLGSDSKRISTACTEAALPAYQTTFLGTHFSSDHMSHSGKSQESLHSFTGCGEEPEAPRALILRPVSTGRRVP